MRIVAVMACRNEAAYLQVCLRHLVRQGIEFAVVDNGSTDGSLDIVESAEFRDYLVAVDHVPWRGEMVLDELLAAKMAMHDRIKSDWAFNICPDEILHSNKPDRTLRQAADEADAAGHNVLNFDEFAFIPVERGFAEGPDGWPTGRHYYFFEPAKHRLMRLWRKGLGFTNVKHGGHRLDGNNLSVAPENLVLRHYIFLSQEHARKKFTQRKFSSVELARGCHSNRVGFTRDHFTFPPVSELECLTSADSFALSRARPQTQHYWQWNLAAGVSSP